MEGLTVASADDDSAADGGGGGGAAGSDVSNEETRRCNAHRAARPPIGCGGPKTSNTLTTGMAGTMMVGCGGGGGGGGGVHNRKKKQQQRQQQQLLLLHQHQQQQQLQLHGGGKKQKKQQKWKANKYRGGRGGGLDRKAGTARGRNEDMPSNNGILASEDDPGVAGVVGGTLPASGDTQNQPQSEQPGSFHQLHQGVGKSNAQSTLQSSSIAQQGSHPHQQTSSVGSQQQQGHGGPQPLAAVQSQKGKHSKQQNLSPMGLRNKRLQSVSKFFLPDKRPRKDCIVPPTKFLLGGNISDPLNLNSLQNESENAVTPKSSPIPTPPHYKAKIEVIIPPNINDPLHLLDPVDSVEYEMQLCSPMKRKQRPRNKRKRKSRTATDRHLDGPPLLAADQLPPPTGAVVEGREGVGQGLEEAATAEEASFTGIGQKFGESTSGDSRNPLATDGFPFPDTGASHHHHHHHQYLAQQHQQSGLLVQQSNYTAGPGAGGSSLAGFGSSVHVGASGSTATGNVTQPDQLDREREKAMRNLKLDLESAGGRKRRTSESTNSTKNKLRRMDSMDKIVSPVIPQPGGWKRAHWPANAGGSGAAGSAGRNRTRTFSTASNTEEQHGDGEGGTANDAPQIVLDTNRHQSVERSNSLSASGGAVGVGLPTDVARGPEELATQQVKPAGSTDEEHQGGGERTGGTVSIIPRPLTALAASSRYHYGNYDRYYGYHSLNEFIDVRLKVFLRNPYLFRDKDILDIGCNVGLMTIAVAKMLHTKTITGIDVDGKLIAKARKNLANYVRLPKKTMSAMAGRRAISTASATVTSDRQQKHEHELKDEDLPTPNISAATAPLATPMHVPELPAGDRIESCTDDGATGGTDEMLEGLIKSSDSVSVATDPDESVANVAKIETEQPATTTLGEAAGQDEPQLLAEDPEQAKQFELKHSALVQRLRQKRHRKQFGGKHQKKNQHHHQHHLRHGSSANQATAGGRGKTEYAHYFPISFPLTMGNLSGKEYQMDIGRPENKFPHNVRFKTMNYVVKDESFINNDTQQYDLILCLSVTKWIHLNYGDAGLKIAFKRMFNHLRPGGKLILEAQNWASYKKKKKLTETIFENYKNIEFFPNRFHDYLLSPEVGFSHSYPLGIPRHLSKGFRRPIQLYIKGDFTPSQAKWSDTYHPGTPYENHRGIYTDIVTASQTAGNCIWGAMTPYAPSYSYRQPSTPSHVGGSGGSGGGGGGGGGSGSGGGSGGFACTSPYYNPRQTDSYLPSYDNIGNNHRPGSYCFASPLYYSTTWSPPSEMMATSGGGGGSYRRSASNTPNSASIRSTDNDEHYYAGAAGGGGSQRRHHVYPPIDVFSPMLGHEHMRSSGSFRNGGGGAMTDSDSEPSSNSASQTPTRQQQFLTDDQSNSPSGHSQPDK
ncbi:7SK snRNA methylphosphate capping enzyme bin3 [Anopheles ziemanni]|uniref:7SK snRNA methylphosphate capping enzyme bin3 n=1 Tax=Anopheles coustani TaxID=139045 RepID=UPI00265B5668|nr:7SK snRNA methylphosphate capping enzyme bin3 [Anopheles coustani]XP_058175360.1 7SK snRNA methylphosphate capping enzyme bin3 [Anopheles ziemanni]